MARITYLTRIEFGEGEIVRLPDFLNELGVKRPLICTDKGLVGTGLVGRIAGLLQDPVIFDGTPAQSDRGCRHGSLRDL
ncbi:iron-containing alcohol dehydrogenase [Limimaricola cinnabarinus]|uniref:iron-containing alcohol dehydrogenase n=1 Tax=Limimaricola cinnabarinus TaxID=1125964 RepID=UPI002284CA8B|nr:iron-containing alcohol dehydrogenase [Limimaricola cinnabarinus]